MMTMRLFRLLCLLLLLSAALPAAYAEETEKPDNDQETEYFDALSQGANFLYSGSSERALARFKQAIKLKPDDARGYFWTGLTYSELQNYGLAANNAEKATIIDDKYADAWLLWGQCLVHMNNWVEARKKLEQAFVLAPQNYLVPFNLGLCYYYGLDEEKKTTALRYFKKSLELNQKYAPALMYEGCCNLDADLGFLAIISFKNAIKLQPDYADAYFWLGVAQRRENHLADAEKAFLQAIKLKPDHYEAHLQLAHMYQIDLLDKKNAEAHYQLFLRYAPEDHEWRSAVFEYLSGVK